MNHKLSSWLMLFGNNDFNSTPLAPLGQKLLFIKNHSNKKVENFMMLKACALGYLSNITDALSTIFQKQEQKFSDAVCFIPFIIPIPECNIEEYI